MMLYKIWTQQVLPAAPSSELRVVPHSLSVASIGGPTVYVLATSSVVAFFFGALLRHCGPH